MLVLWWTGRREACRVRPSLRTGEPSRHFLAPLAGPGCPATECDGSFGSSLRQERRRQRADRRPQTRRTAPLGIPEATWRGFRYSADRPVGNRRIGDAYDARTERRTPSLSRKAFIPTTQQNRNKIDGLSESSPQAGPFARLPGIHAGARRRILSPRTPKTNSKETESWQ